MTKQCLINDCKRDYYKHGFCKKHHPSTCAIDLSLRFTLYVHMLSYRMAGVLASMKEGGIHPKHRIQNHHKFFLDNIEPADRVLDVGCGDGVLTADMASKASFVIGIDINASRIETAKERNMRDNTRYFSGDATSIKMMALAYSQKYEVITMSNVLEHIDKRIDFLSFWGKRAKKLLIRVPALDRGWLPVYMKELGMDYRLDKTHRTEYTVETLNKELNAAGLTLISHTTNFGEILAVVKEEEKKVENENDNYFRPS
ncbi:MAG: class I SAM-dependent methyltransferase [Candidatus Ratteibacteria bacterium]|nr:class I SAM-dependent methyltransferase [Candidatus Ratteibacteria bacterium]